MSIEAKRGRPSGRPRIRTLKPEQPHDDKVSRLSMKAELLYVRLITWADDEGRFDASTNAVSGFAFPRRKISPSQVRKLMKEIADVGLILLYKCDGFDYGVHPNWRQHQVISRPTPSRLPEPPDPEIVRANGPDACNSAVENHGEKKEKTPRPRAGACAPVPVPLPVVGDEGAADAREEERSDDLRVWEHYLAERGKKSGKPLTFDASRRKVVRRALMVRPLEDVLAAVTGLFRDDFMMGRTPRNPTVYDGLFQALSAKGNESIEDRIDRFAQLGRGPGAGSQRSTYAGDPARFAKVRDYGAEAA